MGGGAGLDISTLLSFEHSSHFIRIQDVDTTFIT